MKRKGGWACFALLFLLSILAMVFFQQRYTSIQEGGAEYQWPVKVQRTLGWVPSDYLTLQYLNTRTTWVGDTPPTIGRPAYVVLGVQPNGLLYTKQAQAHRPEDQEYLIVNVTDYTNGIVDFSIPSDRVRVNMEKVNPAYYHGQYRGVVLATLKLRNGEAVVTGVYVKGVPIEQATQVPEEDKHESMETGSHGNGSPNASGSI